MANFIVSTKADRPFAFDNSSPTSIDALIYGHLSLHFLPVLPDPILQTTLVDSYPQLASYLEKCHEFFKPRNAATQRSVESAGWTNIFRDWGVQPGKRVEDFIGIGAFVGGILGYALWRMLRH